MSVTNPGKQSSSKTRKDIYKTYRALTAWRQLQDLTEVQNACPPCFRKPDKWLHDMWRTLVYGVAKKLSDTLPHTSCIVHYDVTIQMLHYSLIQLWSWIQKLHMLRKSFKPFTESYAAVCMNVVTASRSVTFKTDDLFQVSDYSMEARVWSTLQGRFDMPAGLEYVRLLSLLSGISTATCAYTKAFLHLAYVDLALLSTYSVPEIASAAVYLSRRIVGDRPNWNTPCRYITGYKVNPMLKSCAQLMCTLWHTVGDTFAFRNMYVPARTYTVPKVLD